jgi:hypothetical protein
MSPKHHELTWSQAGVTAVHREDGAGHRWTPSRKEADDDGDLQ